MESSKYYECNHDNVYCVHFPNKPGYSIQEITNIFSEFGKVVGVTKAGDEHGFRFVRYRSEEEVQRCVEGLKNHRTIKLLPKKLKPANGNQNNGQRKNWPNKQQESRESKASWASWEQKKFEDNGKFHQNNSSRTEHRETNNRLSNESTATEKGGQGLDKNSQQEIANITSFKRNEDSSKNRDIQVEEIQVQGISKNTFPARHGVNLEKDCDLQILPTITAAAAKTTFRTPLLQSVTGESARNLDDEAAQNKTKSAAANSLNDRSAENKEESAVASFGPAIPLTLPEIVEEELPKLVEKSQTFEDLADTKISLAAAPKPKTLEAEEIVVANVHTDYGVHYILHLFQKHNPISVSPMKIIAKHGLRYCVVYLQSPLQAYDIENEFDNYSLCGKELIVVRAQRLLELVDEV